MPRLKNVPSGLRYQDVHGIVEQIAEEKARQYKKIAFYDEEDIKQEVRIKCFNTLKNFDPTRSGANVKIFLAVCADNRIKDIKRSVVYKHSSPCMRCPFYNQDAATSGIHDCVRYAQKNMCERFTRHDRYVVSKLSINSPVSIDEGMLIDSNASYKIEQTDFIDFLFTHIPSGLVVLFEQFRDMNFNIQAMRPKDRLVIIDTIKEMVELGGPSGVKR